jgi:hypothetical protein
MKMTRFEELKLKAHKVLCEDRFLELSTIRNNNIDHSHVDSMYCIDWYDQHKELDEFRIFVTRV